MKPISIELPDKLAAEVENYIKAGWFGTEAEVVLTALREFLRRNRLELMDRFAREDIEWARKQKKGAA